jgi:hypothetical protein
MKAFREILAMNDHSLLTGSNRRTVPSSSMVMGVPSGVPAGRMVVASSRLGNKSHVPDWLCILP